MAPITSERSLLRYAGYSYDTHSGLYYLQRRYYDAILRQFLSRDPLKSDGAESPYQYCAGNPVAGTDPWGLYVTASGGRTNTWFRFPAGDVKVVPWGPGGFGNLTVAQQLEAEHAAQLKRWGGSLGAGARRSPAVSAAELALNVGLGVNAREDLTDLGIWLSAMVGDAVGEAMTNGAHHSRYENGPGFGMQFAGTARMLGDIGEGQLRLLPYEMAVWMPAVGAIYGGTGVAARAGSSTSPIAISEARLAHVYERHAVGGPARFAGKSKFNPGEDIVGLIRLGARQPTVRQANGRYLRTFDVGRTIGIDRNTGQSTSIMTIITDGDNLWTAFPGRP